MKRLSMVAAGAALGLALSSTFTSSLARGREKPSTGPASQREGVPLVQIAVIGAFPNAEMAEARIASWFTGQWVVTRARLAAELDAAAVFAPSETSGVRLWIVLGTPNSARLFFAVQRRTDLPSRFLVQDVELRSGLDELGIERLAQVAYFSAVAAWEGSVESSRQEVEKGLGARAAPAPLPPSARTSPPPLSRPPLLAPPKPWWHYVGGFTYETAFHGEEGTFIGTGTHAGVARRSGQGELSARFVFQVGFVPYGMERAGVTLRPNLIAPGIVLGTTRSLTSGLWLGVEVGAAFALISHRLPFNERWRKVASDSSPFTPELTLGLGMDWEVGGIKLGLYGNAVVPLADDRLIVEDTSTGERRALLSAWSVQPGFSLRTLF